MIVFGVDQSLLQQNTIMKKYLILLVLSLTFLPGCESSAPSRFIYPSEKAMEVRYLCRLPYLDAKAPHQSWSKSTPAWLIINESKVIIFFENDRTFVLPRTSEVTLPPGKYRCNL
tara:strand:+ start:49 stop:393 length:345 start_codon:yes stop_codon:yes gene_type:complete